MERIGESEGPDPNLIWIYFFLLPTVLHNALIQSCQSNLHNSDLFLWPLLLQRCLHSCRTTASHVRLSHPLRVIM